MRDYELSERAVCDLASIREWYDGRSTDLGNRFIDDVLKAIRAARERPMSFPQVDERTRAVRCQRFPYRVYFIPLAKRIDVLAVYHTAREPSRWNDAERD
jgi:toxin ParE1/3/4